jgi:hypothetical protein
MCEATFIPHVPSLSPLDFQPSSTPSTFVLFDLQVFVEQVEYILYYYMAYSSPYLRGECKSADGRERERSN